MHRLTWFRERYPEQPSLPVAERAGDEVLSLPLSPAHADEDILDAVDAVRRVHAALHGMRRPLRIGLTLVADRARRSRTSSGRSTSRETVDTLLDADPWWFALSVAIMIGTALPMALRWQWLMRGAGHGRLVRLADAGVLRLVHREPGAADVDRRRRDAGRTRPRGGTRAAPATSRRSSCSNAASAARARCCSARSASCSRSATTTSAPTSGSRGSFVLGTLVLIFLFFARSARPLLARLRPLLRRLRVERPLRALYDGVHHFRGHPRLLLGVFVFTTAIQAVRILSIWAAAKAVGIDLGPRIYYVMGPLFFLVLLVPFTLNGIAVREAFFVSFLGSVGVPADQAFAAGFLFFLVTTALALPGAAILLWEGFRGGSRPRLEHG